MADKEKASRPARAPFTRTSVLLLIVVGQLASVCFMGMRALGLLQDIEKKLDALFSTEGDTTPVLEKSDGH